MSGIIVAEESKPSHKADNHQRHHGGRRAIIGAAVVVALGVVLQVSLNIAYSHRVAPGVTVASLDLGGLTASQAQHQLTAKIATQRVKFNVNDTKYDVDPTTIGVKYDIDSSVQRSLSAGKAHGWISPLRFFGHHDQPASVAYTVDASAQTAFITKVVTASGKAPVDASITIANGVPTVQPDQEGKALSAEEVRQAIRSQLAGPTPVSLTPKPQKAPIQASALAPVVDDTKALLATPVSLTYQGRSFAPTVAQKGTWVSFAPVTTGATTTLKPSLNLVAVKNYLATVARQIDVKPTSRMVNVENGVSTETKPGQNGLALDQDALATQITGAVTAKQPLAVEAPTKPVPFPTMYNNTVTLNYPKYLEINLARQHLWAYENGKVVYDSPITSGATGAGFPTITGMFSIQAKQTNRHLVGYQYGPRYNYDVFVKYWMPFSGGYGLHDASWRSSYGGPDYYYGGSHGCVNLPLPTAVWVYGWSVVGTPVWVH